MRVFERQWLVNAILWGNYRRLRNAALDALGAQLPGLTLQIGCAYGDISAVLAQKARASGGEVGIVDVLPQQLENLTTKLTPDAPWGLYLVDIFDTMLLIAEEPKMALLEPIPLRKTQRPQVIPDREDAFIHGDSITAAQHTLENLIRELLQGSQILLQWLKQCLGYGWREEDRQAFFAS